MTTSVAFFHIRGHQTGIMYEVRKVQEYVKLVETGSIFTKLESFGPADFTIPSHPNILVTAIPFPFRTEAISHFKLTDLATGGSELAEYARSPPVIPPTAIPQAKSGVSSVTIDDSGNHLPKTGSY